MRTALGQQVLEFIRKSRMMKAGDRVGVAVSGGADSVALLALLIELRSTLGITLLVLHFDHMLRGAESNADAAFAEGLASVHGLEFVVAREDVGTAARRNSWNLEDAGRRLRYAFFARVVDAGRATQVAVAHTADDQAETVLAHIVRGTGLRGLAGIHPIVESSGMGSIVRPLLETRRRDLRRYLEMRRQVWREDATNLDEHRLRARIRAKLMPVLEHDFSPAIVNHLVKLARLGREEEAFWSAFVEDRFLTLTRFADGGKTLAVTAQNLLSPVPIRASALQARAEPGRALTERLIRRLYEGLRGDCRELCAEQVEQVIYLATDSSSGKRVSLSGGIKVERVFDELVFSRHEDVSPAEFLRETKSKAGAYQYVVNLAAQDVFTISVPELATRFRLKMVDWPLAESDTETDGAALDAALLRDPLILRNWQPGDAYRPRGRSRTRKLKQMFLADRVPSYQRPGWPVLESGGKVAWVRGMPPAEDFCARKGTSKGVVIEEERL